MFGVGVIWLLVSGFTGSGAKRRIGWLVVNVAAIILLSWAAVAHPLQVYGSAKLPLLLLFLLLVADFLVGGTLVRLASASTAGTQVQAAPAPVDVQCPWHPKQVESRLLEPKSVLPAPGPSEAPTQPLEGPQLAVEPKAEKK